MNWNDRVALVAGSTGALGSAVTRVFLEAGATVGALYRGAPPPSHDRLIPLEADVTRTDSVTAAVAALLERAGRIDYLLNTVGGFATGRVIDTPDEEWQRMMSLNLMSGIVLSRAVLPHMTSRGEGRLLHVASRAARHPFPGAAAYLVSKNALLGLVEVLAVELAGTGVTANSLLPGMIDTPANRAASPGADTASWVPPDDVARLMLSLCKPESRHVSGQEILIG